MNVAIIGYGKMGREIEKILVERGHNIGLIIDQDNVEDLNQDNLSQVDVAIEFTTPATAYENILKCFSCGTPVVCGTTAWLDKLPQIEQACAESGAAFFYASNFSVGVNVMFKVNELMASMMNRFDNYDVTIEEVHHTQKKDAPSGTAITLAEGVLDNLDRKTKWVGETTIEPEELEILAVRRSIVPGTHTVTYESAIDQLTMTHTAKGRQGFALGAVLASEFLCGKKGVYSMKDLMGF